MWAGFWGVFTAVGTSGGQINDDLRTIYEISHFVRSEYLCCTFAQPPCTFAI